ncbi:restriction endonuclease subunit S [Paenibacillus protaetiae]|uniref:Restriction endonuclease subunit S n=1 Tax=Paenibacillus protaetiae TaxID=2509456 RepID=A0A4P6EUI5_9BACL|nr:restriction endonuclease subunit S [Paenibacillus protaetiae]QAY66604.1 restriction endonuclease subunit S [Paenibacillus protaetiae]
MSRETAYMQMLKASVSMQRNMAIILEAKAYESEKARNWICGHYSPDSFEDEEQQLKQSLQVHDQIVELIEGVTKYSQGMVAMLRAVMQSDDDENESSGYYGGGRRG